MDEEQLRRKQEWMIHVRSLRKKRRRHRHYRERGPEITQENFLEACIGSCGIVARVARRLKVGAAAVRCAIRRPGWERCLQALRDEQERILDRAENTVDFMIRQRDDYKTALSASKFALQTKGKSRGWRQEVIIQGGGEPLKIETTKRVTLDSLNLPLETRRQILERMEELGVQEAELSSPPPEEPEVRRPVIRVRRIVN